MQSPTLANPSSRLRHRPRCIRSSFANRIRLRWQSGSASASMSGTSKHGSGVGGPTPSSSYQELRADPTRQRSVVTSTIDEADLEATITADSVRRSCNSGHARRVAPLRPACASVQHRVRILLGSGRTYGIGCGVGGRLRLLQLTTGDDSWPRPSNWYMAVKPEPRSRTCHLRDFKAGWLGVRRCCLRRGRAAPTG